MGCTRGYGASESNLAQAVWPLSPPTTLTSEVFCSVFCASDDAVGCMLPVHSKIERERGGPRGSLEGMLHNII